MMPASDICTFSDYWKYGIYIQLLREQYSSIELLKYYKKMTDFKEQI